jgi:hypothetical protein
MFKKILHRFFLCILVSTFTFFSLLSYFLDIKIDAEGIRLGKIAFEPYFCLENVALRYEKDCLFIDIDTAHLQKKVLDFFEGERVFEKLGFSIRNGFLKGENTIGFSLDYPPREPLQLVVEQTFRLIVKDQSQIELGFDRLSIKDLKEWVKEFYYHPSFEWISSGIIDGCISLDIIQKKPIKSDLVLENIHGGNEDSGSEIFIEKIRLLSDQKMDVLNGSIRFVEPKEGYDFGIENLAGVLRWNQDHGVFFNLDGLLRQGEDSYPLFLEGCRGKNTIFEADASLLLDHSKASDQIIHYLRQSRAFSQGFSEKNPDLNIVQTGLGASKDLVDFAGIKRYFHISLENPKEGLVILKGLFDHVVESELHALKQLFKPNIVELDLIHIEELKAKFEIKGVWENGHLTSISAENMQGDALVSFHGQPPVPLGISGSYSDSGVLQCQILDKTSKGNIDLYIKDEKMDVVGVHMSSSLMNALLTPFRDGWVLEGVADVCGQIEKNRTDLHLSSSDLTFIDQNVEFYLTQQPLHADFLILEDQNVQGILQCQSGVLKISQLMDQPLVFSELKSKISIWNEEVYLEDVSTCFKTTQLLGNLSLKPISTGGRRLELEVEKAKGPIENFSEWFHPLDKFIQGEVELDSRGFRLQADLILGGDLDYEIDLNINKAKVGSKDSPYAFLDCTFYHSTWLHKTRFDLHLGEESVDWLRFSGQIDNQFLTFDPNKNHLFQRPFKQIVGGKGEGGIAFELSKEEIEAFFTLIRVEAVKNLSHVECFLGFKDFGNFLAGTLKADHQEWNFFKEGEIFTLKKGAFSYEGFTTTYEDVHLDLTTMGISSPSITVQGVDTDINFQIDKGNLKVLSGLYRGFHFESVDPVHCTIDGFWMKCNNGSFLIDRQHRFFLSSVKWDLFSQNIELKSSKIDFDPISWLTFRTSLSGWVKGEVSPDVSYLDLKMTPFSGSVLGQNMQVHQFGCLLHKDGFTAQMEGIIDHLHFKTSIKTIKKGFDRIKCSLETDLGKAFVVFENHPSDGWIVHESKGDLLGLVWSCVPAKNSQNSEKISLVGSWTLDPYLFENGLNTFKIPLKIPYKIEKPICLTGVLEIHRAKDRGFAFKGDLFGRNMKIEGIHCRNLFSKVKYEEGQLSFSKVRLVDPAFDLEIDQCDVLLSQNEALFEGVRLLDFRPSALKNTQGSKPEDPFVIKELVVPSLWTKFKDKLECKGKGELYFINRENRKKNIADLPWDILGVLGLDPSLLVPICGHLEFSLDKDKVFLERLKRSFSDSHRSSFFLDPKNLSYISLDGKLSIRLRMKQSVILKLTEPFMIVIDGSILNPLFKLK